VFREKRTELSVKTEHLVKSELSFLEETLQACCLLPLYKEGDDHWQFESDFLLLLLQGCTAAFFSHQGAATDPQTAKVIQDEEEIIVEFETVNEAGTWEVTHKCSSLQMCARRKKSY
jgi:hypothetical protein